MSWKLPILALSQFLLLGAFASADDTVTLNIPVNVKNLSTDVGSVSVLCKLLDASQTEIATAWSSQAPVDAIGNYSGSFTVKMSMPTGALSKAKTYQCLLTLNKPGGVVIATMYPGNVAACASLESCKPAPGAPFVGTVSGPIPASGPMFAPPIRRP